MINEQKNANTPEDCEENLEHMVKAHINGKEVTLHYSIEVMFAVNEKYGSAQAALDELIQDNARGFECLRYLTVALANDAEQCRREAGIEASPLLSEADISQRMCPEEYQLLKWAVCEAIRKGYQVGSLKTPEPNEN